MDAYVYFSFNNGTQKGPVTYEDLKIAGIGKDTLVWRDGFDDWQEAGSILELSGLFIGTPTATELIPQEDVRTSSEEQIGYEKPELDNTKMFKNAFLFKGRARRTEFCISYAIYEVCIFLFGAMSEVFEDSGFVAFLGMAIFIGALWFSLSEGTRRCHDLGHSGFWMLIPYYLLWMLFQNSKEGSNEYGNNPKGQIFKKLY